MKISKKKISVIIKTIISIWLVYHLTAAIFLPNPSSYFSRNYGKYLTNYANQIGLNQSWVFFSPDPTMIYTIYYRAEDADANEENNIVVEGKFPTTEKSFLLSYRTIKEYYQIRFLMKDMNLFEKTFVSWLCSKNKITDNVHITMIMNKPPSLEKATILSEFKFPENYEKQTIYNNMYSCKDFLSE